MRTNTISQATMNKDWLRPAARAGYAARGIVYLMIGGLAMAAAFGSGDAEGSRGALSTLLGNVWGQVLLGLVALGLFAFAAWRFFQAAFDADNHGSGMKGSVIRAGLFGSSIVHLFLAAYAASLLLGRATGGGSESGSQSAIAWLMQQPFGQWLVALVGACVIVVGITQVLKAVKEKFLFNMNVPEKHKGWAVPISKAGLIARAVVFFIIGGFIIIAAYQVDPSEVRGLEGALETLQSQAYGPWLLGAVALGLIAFGVYSFLEATYREIYV